MDTQTEGQPQAVHTGYVCDICGMNPIVGVRYKCANCVDFDLCQCKPKPNQPTNQTNNNKNITSKLTSLLPKLRL